MKNRQHRVTPTIRPSPRLTLADKEFICDDPDSLKADFQLVACRNLLQFEPPETCTARNQLTDQVSTQLMFTLLHSGTFGSVNYFLSLMFTAIPATWIIEYPVISLPESLGPVDTSAFQALSFVVVYNPVSPTRGCTISRDSALPICILHPPLLVSIRGDATNQSSTSDSQALARSRLNSVATTAFAIFSRMWELKHTSLNTPPMPDWLIFFGIIYLPDRVDIVGHRWVHSGSSFHVVSDVVESFAIGGDEKHTRGIDNLFDLAMCLMTLQRHVFRMTALWEDFTWPWPEYSACYNSIYESLGFWTPSPSEAAEREGIVLRVRYCDNTPLTDDQSSWSAALEEKLTSRQAVADWAAHVSTYNQDVDAEDVACEGLSTTATQDCHPSSLPETLASSGFLNIYTLSASVLTAQGDKDPPAICHLDDDIRARCLDIGRGWYSTLSELPIQIPCALSDHSDTSHSDEVVWGTIYRSLVYIIRHGPMGHIQEVQLKSAPPPHPAPDFFRPLRSDRIRKSFLALFLCFPQMFQLAASNKALTESFLASVFELQEIPASFSSVIKAHISTSQPGFSPVLALVELKPRMWREHIGCDPPLPPHLPRSMVAHYAALEALTPSLKYMIWVFYYRHPDMYPWLSSLPDGHAPTKHGLLPEHYILHSFTLDDQTCALDFYWPSLRAVVDGKHHWDLHSWRVETYITGSPYMENVFKFAAVVFQVKKHADALQADMRFVELPDGFVDKLLPHVQFELSRVPWL
ncbi:hypothetical protein HGRIS_004415 [Hohenbuehelia grisea]|uniref:Uncharacterized protein n=1 Tax=Hohenbuehelia grisea TaxID=104357 RepID=A0ABR3JC70_9AGAR